MGCTAITCIENYSPYTHSPTHTITIFEKHQELTVLIHTSMQVHVLPLTYTYMCMCVYTVLFSLKVVFL
jgi:hypothetical protein